MCETLKYRWYLAEAVHSITRIRDIDSILCEPHSFEQIHCRLDLEPHHHLTFIGKDTKRKLTSTTPEEALNTFSWIVRQIRQEVQ